jgi:ribosomal protein L11 methyltransferase
LTLSAASDYHGAMPKQPIHNRAQIPLGRGGQWLELTLMLPASCAEEVGATLVALGSPGVVEESAADMTRTSPVGHVAMAKVTAAFRMEQVGERLLREVRECLDRLESEGGVAVTATMQLTRGDAWVEQWKHFYHPFKVGPRLVIRPPWETYAAAPEDLVLTLNPGQAFGSGLHPTTQLCLEVLEACMAAQPGVRLLDVGCGSGILSLAAVLFGGIGAYGIDLDPVAVRVARINARLNHLSRRVAFAIGSLEVVNGPFEVVVANILLEPILALLPAFRTLLAPGGRLILSGILAAEVPQLQRRLSTPGWRISQQTTREEWAAVVCAEG